MQDCNKFKKSGYIGLAFFVGGMIFAFLGRSLHLGDVMGLFIIFGATIVSMVKMLPYIRCLSDYNKRIK